MSAASGALPASISTKACAVRKFNTISNLAGPLDRQVSRIPANKSSEA